MAEAFTQTLEAIAALAQKHPDYQFEMIHNWTQQIQSGQSTPADWVQEVTRQWQAMPDARRDICQQIFEQSLLRAKQATYQPVNALDAFLERYLYGIQDEQVIQKSLVSKTLKQIDDSQRRSQTAPIRPPQPGPSPGGLTPRAGRTNPLPPTTRLPEA
ncbi:MAG: hypothetical protein IGS03_05260 [Candidatus Sericytochromatia bacterium]|nr:hypothetical protein [Candidatus Sericytochromatia bacterium]